MDIEKLIERLRNNNIENNCHDCALGYYAFEAATALSTLQAKYKSRDSLVDRLEDDVARLLEENEMLKEALKKYEVF